MVDDQDAHENSLRGQTYRPEFVAKLIGCFRIAILNAALAVLAFGVAGRAAATVSWALFAACVVLGPLGALLGVPDAVADVSPFTHAPAVPAAVVHALPETVLCLLAVLLAVVGITAFRRRDLDTS